MHFLKSQPVSLINFVTSNLAEKPENIKINTVEGVTSMIFELRADTSDLGRIIGRSGKIAKALRVLLNATTSKKVKFPNDEVKQYRQYLLEIIED